MLNDHGYRMHATCDSVDTVYLHAGGQVPRLWTVVVASPWRAGRQAPAASPCPSPLTLASSPTELLVRRVAIAHGTANRARTDTTGSPPLISSPPAHTPRYHWSTHACRFLPLGHLLKKPSLTLHLYTTSSLKQRRGMRDSRNT